MLKQIRCEIFREKVIDFHDGLNVVMGDNNGTNSIGKSTLLMIIDFIFGGTTYIKFHKDVVSKLGHHEFFFVFEFEKVEHYFSRDTEESDTLYKCTKEFKKIEEISLSEFCNFLKHSYSLDSDNLTFRSAVSPFLRIWGKNNYDVKRLLHTHHSEKNVETISKLIKLFNEYNKLVLEDIELKKLKTSKSVLDNAGKHKYIPKITKTTYDKNIKEIVNLKKEIEDWSKSAYSPVINISEIISDELIEIRERKNLLIQEREYYKSRLNRTNRTINNSTDVGFETLLEFFPQVNIEKLQAVEMFHEGISTILSMELARTKKELLKKIESLDEEIKQINKRMEEVLNPNEEPNLFIENLLESSSKLKNIQMENDYYLKLKTAIENYKDKTIAISELKEDIIEKIMKNINNELKLMNKKVHLDERTAPNLSLTNNDYEYSYDENTGTGNAFANLVIFDLAIFNLTDLPIIIHDSLLLKNIEKPVVEKIIDIYDTYVNQIFISIDVIKIYSKVTQKKLLANKVIQLSNERLLFTMDWRNSSRTSDNK
jgi:hypothetical protein